jgi:polyhydroxybutyrate depolymerase
VKRRWYVPLVLVGCALGSRGQGSAESSETTDAPGNVADVCARAPSLPLGVSEQRIESGGLSRRLLIHTPAALEKSAPLPVVFTLHGSGGTPEEQLALSGFAALAERHRFLVVAPEAIGQRWNVPPDAQKPDDVRFIADSLDAVARLACVDRARVYTSGFSGGARMSSQLACELSDRLAAAAAVGGVRFPGPCRLARPFPMLAFHGTGDEVNPYDGGGEAYWGTGVDAAIQGWAAHNGCTEKRETAFAPGVTEVAHLGAGCTDVVLYRIEGFGHSWPTSLSTNPAASGAAPVPTANDVIWSFFEAHPSSVLPE